MLFHAERYRSIHNDMEKKKKRLQTDNTDALISIYLNTIQINNYNVFYVQVFERGLSLFGDVKDICPNSATDCCSVSE